MDKKPSLLKAYSGQTKEELLREIRELFPLPEGDKRAPKQAEKFVEVLERLLDSLQRQKEKMPKRYREKTLSLLTEIEKEVQA